MPSEIHQYDIGTQFYLTVKDQDGVAVNLASATDRFIIFTKPDFTVVTNTGFLVTDGTDGRIFHTAASGDLDQDGYWKIQARVVFPTGSWYTDKSIFIVHPNS